MPVGREIAATVTYKVRASEAKIAAFITATASMQQETFIASLVANLEQEAGLTISITVIVMGDVGKTKEVIEAAGAPARLLLEGFVLGALALLARPSGPR